MSSATSEPPAHPARAGIASADERRTLAAAPPMAPPEDGLSPLERHKALEALWSSGRGLQRLSSVNHTVLSIRIMLTASVFFGAGGLLAMLIRAQLATPETAFLDAPAYAQVFTMHGTLMMFLFAIPMLEGIAMYLLPKMMGARGQAFPRLSAFGYWCYLFGGVTLLTALVLGIAPASGWFMYTPLSSDAYSPGINSDIWLLGITLVEISSIAVRIKLSVTILRMRAPGMSLARMPIFAWYMLITALMIVVGFPPLAMGSLLLEAERAFGLPFFDPTRGGDPLLWQHLFWIFGHPEVYIIFLPAAGMLATLIPTFARRPLVAYKAVVAAIVAMGIISFLIWAHHMFTVGMPRLAVDFFAVASSAVVLPTAVQLFALIATRAAGRMIRSVPMLYAFGFFAVFVNGGLTGVMVAVAPFNFQVHDTHFVVAHMHYVLFGSLVFGALAGLYYWLPHLTGRLSIHRLSIPAFWLIFLGFNGTFLLMHLTGLLGMPRRVHSYGWNDGWAALNLVSSVAGFIQAMGFGLVILDVILTRRHGPAFRRNPWGAQTLEWATATPPTNYNFAALPHIDRRGDTLDPGAPARYQAVMLKTRIIPCLDVADGRVVKGVNFVDLIDAGDPVQAAAAYDGAGADELCFLDIHATHENRGTMYDLVTRTAEQCFIPLTVGGGVRSPEDVRALLLAGADKVSFNSAAVADPDVIARAADRFGSQCIVCAIDAKTVEPGRWEIFTHGGRRPTGIDAVEFARTVADKGAGEILLTSMDRDGTRAGFNIPLTRAIADAVDIPVIASGGVGTLDHLVEGVRDGHASAVLAASIFHFGTYTIAEAKAHMAAAGIPVRLE